jgi:ketopantoate hydroxymethyltransferase
MISSIAMTIEMGIVNARAPTPASIRVLMAASVPYATEERASDERTASARNLLSRSWDSIAEEIGCPTRKCLAFIRNRPVPLFGSVAAGRGTNTPEASPWK